MAITNSIRQVLGGMGTASVRGGAVTSTTIAANAVTATLPTIAPAVNCGMFRIKVSNVDVGHAITSIVVTGSDGTTTIYLDTFGITAGVNGQGADLADEFQSDLNLKNFVAVVAAASGVTTMTVDFEVWGQGNAGGP